MKEYSENIIQKLGRRTAVRILSVGVKDKIKRLENAEKDGGTRSISYHESGHTAMRFLLQSGATQRYQTVTPHGTNRGMSGIVKNSNQTPLSIDECIGILLAGFSAQRLLEKDPSNNPKQGTIAMQYSIEHKIRFFQPDVLSVILILGMLRKRGILKKSKQKEIIEKLISIITHFFQNNPKLLKFIIRLSYLNQRKSTLDTDDINNAADYAQISPLDVVGLANKFRNLNFTKIIQEA